MEQYGLWEFVLELALIKLNNLSHVEPAHI